MVVANMNRKSQPKETTTVPSSSNDSSLRSPELSGQAATAQGIIEKTFNVFCGHEPAMDQVRFAEFCESSKRIPATGAHLIFTAVVRDREKGMELDEFKQALTLLLEPGCSSHRKQAESKDGKRPRDHIQAACPEAESSPTFCWNSAEFRNCIYEEEEESCLTKQSRAAGKKKTRTIRWSPVPLE
jgi:hypothetical protein